VILILIANHIAEDFPKTAGGSETVRDADVDCVKGQGTWIATEQAILGRRNELVHRNLLFASSELGQLSAVSTKLLSWRSGCRSVQASGAGRRWASVAGSRWTSESVRHVSRTARRQVLCWFRLPWSLLRHRVVRRRHQSLCSSALRQRRNRLPGMCCRHVLLTKNFYFSSEIIQLCFVIVTFVVVDIGFYHAPWPNMRATIHSVLNVAF